MTVAKQLQPYDVDKRECKGRRITVKTNLHPGESPKSVYKPKQPTAAKHDVYNWMQYPGIWRLLIPAIRQGITDHRI